jgi:hypothetical protein
MTEQSSAHTEDLALEADQADAVVGGRSFADAEREMKQLEGEGYVAQECTPEGTLMVNPHTHHKKLVRG